MALLELPTLTNGEPHYSFRTQLDGADYEFEFRFGERRGAWVFDLRRLTGNVTEDILLGQLVTTGRDFLRRVSAANRPPGKLWAFNIQRPADPFELPGLTDLGPDGRCRLYYTEVEE